VIGGEDENDSYLSDVHILDTGICSILFYKCYIYDMLISAKKGDIYHSIIYSATFVNADTLIWSKLCTSGQLLPPRAGHSTVSFGMNLFVFGGFTDAHNLYNDLYMLNIGMFDIDASV